MYVVYVCNAELVAVNRNKNKNFVYGLVYGVLARKGVQKCANKEA